jgi:lysophospholipase L1-like esterase
MKTHLTLVVFGLICAGASLVTNPADGEPLATFWPSPPSSWQAPSSDAELPLEEVNVGRVDLAALSADAASVPSTPVLAADGSGASADAPLRSPEEEAAERARDEAAAQFAQAQARDAQLLTLIRQVIADSGGDTHPLRIPCLESRADGTCARGALDRFYEALRLTALGEATRPVRVSQFGDSLVVGDTLLAELRTQFGEQFGYGGHGFVFIGNPERPVGAADVRVSVSDEWAVRTVVLHSASDPLFGIGGAMFTPEGAPYIDLRVDDAARGFTRAGLLYFATYGPLTVRVRRGDADAEIATLSAERGSSGLDWFTLEPGVNRIRLNAFSQGARYYGVILENETGVVLDNLGLVSSRAERLLRIDEEHWASQLALRDPDVVSLFYGVNAAWEGSATAHFADNYREDFGNVLARLRRVAPERDCMAIAPLVRGTSEGGRVTVFPSIAAMTEIQRELADAHGCASWSAYEAAGGDAGIQRWRDQGWLGSDLAHPSPAGYRDLARKLYLAWLGGFVDYLERRSGP